MKKIDKTQFLILLLIAITGFSYFKMNQLTIEVAQLQWQLNAQENSIINQIRGVETIVDQIRAADRWYEEVESPKLVLVNDDRRLSLKI